MKSVTKRILHYSDFFITRKVDNTRGEKKINKFTNSKLEKHLITCILNQ